MFENIQVKCFDDYRKVWFSGNWKLISEKKSF